MPSFLIGTSYAVSAGLILYSVQTNLAPKDWKFALVLVWAIAGLALTALAIMWPRKTGKE